MTNIVLCFGQAGHPEHSHVSELFELLDDDQVTWWHEVSPRWRTASDHARQAVTLGYRYLAEHWQPGDQIFVFGAGRGGACAQSLSRLLGTIGVLDGELVDYMLSTYAVPRTARTGQDWDAVSAVAAGVAEQADIAVPVRFLGVWDATRTARTDGPVRVAEGRHAMAIDGGPQLQRVDGVDEVWFRGTHRGVLTDPLTFDWMLDGATGAGLRVRTAAPAHVPTVPVPRRGTRRVPDASMVHASVEMHLRDHPEYWRRLPAEVVWSDADWMDRAERLVQTEPKRQLAAQALAVAS